MVLWIAVIFTGVISDAYVECYSGSVSQLEGTKIVKKGFPDLSQPFLSAVAPTNFTVEASPSNNTKYLQLSLSWNLKSEGQQASSFNIHAWSLNDSDFYCNSEPYYAYVENPNSTSWVIPPKTMHESTHHVSTFSISPGCFYRVKIEANPHDGKTYNQIDYEVPDCVQDICSCRHAEKLPRPDLYIKHINQNLVNITWTITDLQNISKSFLRVGPKLLDGSNAAMYNLSWSVEKPATFHQVYYEQFGATTQGKYAATVRVVDGRQCLGPEQQIVFLVGNNLSLDGTFLKNKIFWFALLTTGLMLLVFYVLLIHNGQKCIYWLDKKLHACNLNDRVFYQAIRVKSERVFRRNNSLQERNILYVEKEIEEAKVRGEVDGFEISYNRLTFLREIGRGAFGQVFLAKAEAIRGVPGSRLVAVKKLRVQATPEEREEFLEEIAMLKKVGQHPNVISLLACCTLKCDICMVMEYVPCGDLLNYLRSLRQKLDARKASVTSLQEHDVMLSM